jgi:hypothetical protein
LSAGNHYHGTVDRANDQGNCEAGDDDRSPDSRCLEIRCVAKCRKPRADLLARKTMFKMLCARAVSGWKSWDFSPSLVGGGCNGMDRLTMRCCKMDVAALVGVTQNGKTGA